MTTKLDIPPRYDHRAAETKWYERWESSGAFRAGQDTNRKPFTMVIPPPNITGALHMGHALNNTIQDIYARYWRMNGRDVLWLPGTDHAGIATQNVVEKMLKQEGKKRDDLGREAFVKRVWQWKEESGGTIVRQLRRLGASCDWSRERFTMDEGLSRAVVEVFVRLFSEGLIYRADRLVNWCTRCATALSDIECEHVEQDGNFWHIRYPFADGSGELVIATTRPETMLGDTAVAVHPEDERYRHLVGRDLILPLVGRRIPLIADEYVDKEFGTGAVKITPGHDPNDYEVGRRHKLPMIKAFTAEGRIAAAIMAGAAPDSAARRYVAMKLMECRTAVVADLESAGLLVKTEPHRHAVGHCYRCKTAVEPYLTPQWFVRAAPLAAPAIKAVETGETRIVPEAWSKTYFEWMRNIRDWCISRQIWWGHQIPAWYCRACDREHIREVGGQPVIDKNASPLVAATKPAACPRCHGTDLLRDPDVLDTWFSSALWPFSTLGWPDRTPDLARYYPTTLLVTGFDILFFWVARMMMMGLKFMDKVPFHEVYIHALVRDAEGKKMSKSRGNVIDPLTVTVDLGADAFRFTLAAFCAQGRDIKLDEKRIEGYRNFVTKIWNAARLVLTVPDDHDPRSTIHDPRSEVPEDRWIISRLSATIAAVRSSIESYNLDRAADATYSFFWHEFCDWYLELIKPRLRAASDTSGGQIPNSQFPIPNSQSAAVTARHVLAQSLRLMHPFMPFVTDELNELMGDAKFLDHDEFPKAGERDLAVEADFERLMAVITAIRRIRTEFKIPPAEKVEAHLVDASPLAPHLDHVRNLAHAEPHIHATRPALTQYASEVVAGVEILVPLAGLIDIDKEKGRLGQEIAECEKAIASSRKRLEDPAFAAKAPEDIIAASRATLAEREDRLRRLTENLKHL